MSEVRILSGVPDKMTNKELDSKRRIRNNILKRSMEKDRLKLVLILLTSLFIFSIAYAEETIMKSLDLGFIPHKSFKEAANPFLSKDGKIIYFAPANKVILVDYPQNCENIINLLTNLQKNIKNVEIKIEFIEHSTEDISEAKAKARYSGKNWKITTGGVAVGTSDRGFHGTFSVGVGKEKSDRTTTQIISVLDGHTARFLVVEEYPQLEWFRTYGIANRLIEAEFTYRSVGAKLAVVPVIQGNLIKVSLTPELSYFTDKGKKTVKVNTLTTTVVVRNGQSICLGGHSSSNKDFSMHFFRKIDKSGKFVTFDVILTPKIKKLQKY